MCRQNENIKFKIRNALGLGKNECEIEDADNAYTVKPIAEKKELYIHSIRSVYGKGSNIHLFRLCNLTFEACIFTCEVNLQGEVDANGKAIAINNTINFKNCTFHKPISFLCVMFDGDIVFRHSTFEDIVYFKEIIFNSETEFSWCNFKNKTNLENSIFSELDMSNSAFQHINIQQAKFKSGTDFSNCKFQDEADFSGSIFSQKANFTQAIFRASAYFDKAIFKGDTIFKRSEFCENAHFYQTEFSENLDFFQAMFNEYLNLTGTTIFNFNFEQIKFLIEQESEKIKKANEFRDIFKNIKNALIKSGNLLGASRFRKMELYCKEIELDLRKKENTKSSEFRDIFKTIKNAFIENDNLLDASHFHKMELYCEEIERRLNKEYKKESHDISVKSNNIPYNNKIETYTKEYEQKREKSEKPDIRDFVDRIQLMFYRLTSDHHTDLLLILNNVIFLIALFGCVNLVFVVLLHYYDTISSILWSLISCAMFVFMAICFMLEPKINGYYTGIVKIPLVIIELFISGILAGIYGVMIIFFIESIGIFNVQIKRIFMLILSYCIVLFALISQPSFLLPILGKIIDIEKINAIFAFESLNIVYTIFLFLLLFSLQKTARKNTIVPN